MFSIQFKRGSAAQNDGLTLNAGVLSIDTENNRIRLHDGLTAGGHTLAVADDTQSLQDQIDALGIADVEGLDVALASKIALTEIGTADGIAGLNPEGYVPTEQLPSFVEDVIEVADEASLPTTGEVGKLYVALDVNELFRWSGGQQKYYRITALLETTDDLSEGQVNLYFTDPRVRSALSANGSLTYDATTGVFDYTRSVNTVQGRTGAISINKVDVDLGNVQDFSIASEAEAVAAQRGDVYITPSLKRSFIESVGFNDTEGFWVYGDELLPVLRLQGNWTQLTSGPVAILRHSAVAINGKMVVYGGRNEARNEVNTLFEYDPATDTWTQLPDGPIAVQQHSAVTINDKVVMFGGRNGTTELSTLFEYDPSTDTWTQLTSGPVAIALHSSVAINDKMFVYGGQDSSGKILNTLYLVE